MNKKATPLKEAKEVQVKVAPPSQKGAEIV